MKKRFYTVLRAVALLLCFAAAAQAYTKRDLLTSATGEESLKTLVSDAHLWVRYPDYADRAGWDKLLGPYREQYIRDAERCLDYQWKHIKATDYMEFFRSGSRTIMENPYSANNRAFCMLLMGELAEGKGRFIDQIANGVYLYCEMTTWSLSAHLTNQREKTRIPSHREHIIDLTAGNVAATLSWTYYFLKDRLAEFSPLIPERMRSELQERILDNYLNTDHFWWMALPSGEGKMVNNWNPWCNSNVLTAFLLLEEDPDKRAAGVWKTMRSVDQFLNYNHDDGACEEGPSYWGHAAGKLYDYLQLLSDATQGRVSVFDRPLIRNLGEYIYRSYIGDGWVVNFADASARGGGDPDLIFAFGKAVGSDDMQAYAAFLNRRSKTDIRPAPDDAGRILRTLENRDALKSCTGEYAVPEYTWYPQTEFCYMNDGDLFVAAKGGNNNESHNHNDAGSCLFYLRNQPVLIDVGVGTYTRQTFSNERYTIWTMQSQYHNLPMINGAPQRAGGQYRAANTAFDAKAKRFSTDIAGAYPAEAGIRKWVRSYQLKKGTLIVRDDFEGETPQQNHELHFICRGKAIATDRGVTIDAAGAKVLLGFDPKTLDARVEPVEVTDKRLSDVWGDTVYRIVLTAKERKAAGTYLCTISEIPEK